MGVYLVDPLGFEPRIFWLKTRRVASYTMEQYVGMGRFEPVEHLDILRSKRDSNPYFRFRKPTFCSIEL